MRLPLLSTVALLGACTTAPADGDPPPPPPLAADMRAPVLALFEHAVEAYFAGAGDLPPTTCAVFRSEGDNHGDSGLSAAQEERLLKRFPRLAPADRCQWDGSKYADSITGDPATVIDVYRFRCEGDSACTGWVNTRGQGACEPAAQYRMRFAEGRWRFTRDERVLAQ
ncbi:conserved hypothetical protein [Altererythrobacter sp. B11]|uniref:hypothetical protein n=1 Tax=Altererythrobacter sp. B11 TaxID=2060312 RepID=UPI000DC72508|nr:hypothetical protein [Altererythrobacter sp. B11]BBC72458.1 conserved hypothetical protein [Altererythrobacter sp. B11]